MISANLSFSLSDKRHSILRKGATSYDLKNENKKFIAPDIFDELKVSLTLNVDDFSYSSPPNERWLKESCSMFEGIISDHCKDNVNDEYLDSSTFHKLLIDFCKNLSSKVFNIDLHDISYTSFKDGEKYFTDIRHVFVKQPYFNVQYFKAQDPQTFTQKHVILFTVPISANEFITKDYLASKLGTHDIWVWRAGLRLKDHTGVKSSTKSYLDNFYKYYKEDDEMGMKNKTVLMNICLAHLDELVEIANEHI